MDPTSWLSSLFGPGAAQAASSGFGGVPQATSTMMYPFDTPQAQAFPEPPAPMPQGGVAGGALPTAPAPLAYSPPSPEAGGAGAPTPGVGGQKPNALLDALRGVKAPPVPEAQKVATPHLVAQKALQGGQLPALMASLGLGPRDVFQLPRLQRPA